MGSRAGISGPAPFCEERWCMERDSYSAFAYVYDELMDNVPYDAWAEYLTMLLRKNGVFGGIVCELGCGTGQITRRLSEKGYDMIGIDLSEDMLEVAREQEYEKYEEDEPAANTILYLQQDMQHMCKNKQEECM